MLDPEKKSLQFAASLMVGVLSLLIILEFLMHSDIMRPELTGIRIFDRVLIAFILKAKTKIVILRGSLVLGMIVLSSLQYPVINNPSILKCLWDIFLSVVCITVFMAGYGSGQFYNIVLYPVIFAALFVMIPRGLRAINQILIIQNPVLKNVSRQNENFSFIYKTDKGPLSIRDIRTATFIEGSAKAGKTASIIIPTIVQAAQNQFAGLIYDYEGNLTEDGGGLLTHVAYTAIKNFPTPVKFGIINFTDLSRTMRCNPLSSQYIQSYNHALELATVIMYNINRSWSRHKDFWGENAIAAYAATIWFFQRNYPSFSTIPHITEFLLNDFKDILRILNTDDDVAPYIRPILAALERDASGQIAGAESSTQFPLARMRSPEVYYVFNPDPGNELDLDITNTQHPVLLCVCNAPEIQNALAPSIGAIIQVCKVQMNKLGKHKSIFLFDEMPTIYIDNADKIPAEARKKSVCSFFSVQTYDQLVRDYGHENARVIRNSCGNLFIGITSVESAEMVSKMMGDYKRAEYSRTTGDSGHSVTQSLRNERVLMPSDIAAQQTGHFSGRILGGKPAYFSARLKYKHYPVEQIPHFNYPVELDDIEVQQQLLAALVTENYQRIKKDIKDLIRSYSTILNENSEKI